MKTETGLTIVHEGARVNVYTPKELRDLEAQTKWWKKAIKTLLA